MSAKLAPSNLEKVSSDHQKEEKENQARQETTHVMG
jgi:hypothetical protein